jgi:hypothetical protein
MAFNLFASSPAAGWPPCGKELVGSPAEKLGLGAQRLVEHDLGRLIAIPLTDTADPAPALEALHTGRVLNDSVERDVLAYDELSHSTLLWWTFPSLVSLAHCLAWAIQPNAATADNGVA